MALEVSKEDRSKDASEEQFLNIELMLVTLEVSKEDKFPQKSVKSVIKFPRKSVKMIQKFPRKNVKLPNTSRYIAN